jgi:hypothetical protein
MTVRQPLASLPLASLPLASLPLASLRAAGLAVMSAAFLAGAASPARALDDGDENIFKSVTNAIGFGLFNFDSGEEKPRINYRERAPLVVPPNLSQLPAPAPRAGERNQAWPQDADVTRRQQAQERNRRPRDNEQQMSVEEMRRIRTTGASPTAPTPANCGESGLERLCDPASFWARLREARSTRDDSRDLVAGQEPPRRALTDPPRGLRTPSQAVQYTFEPRREIDGSDPRAQYREEIRRREAAQRGENID